MCEMMEDGQQIYNDVMFVLIEIIKGFNQNQTNVCNF